MSGVPNMSADGDAVTLGAVALDGSDPRFLGLNSQELTLGAEKRRENRRDDVGPYGRRSTRVGRMVPYRILVDGTVDAEGDPVNDPIVGLEQALDYLQAQTLDAPEDDFGCIPCTVVRKSGRVLAGGVQVDDMARTYGPSSQCVVTLRLQLPTGRLDVVEEED